MSLSPKIARRSAALALAAALLAAPAARATGPSSPFARGWQGLVRLIAREGLGLDPNGTRRASTTPPLPPRGGASVAAVARAVVPGSGDLR
jgi:hypothetical protein